MFLESEAFASIPIRFHLVFVEAGDYLRAAKQVKELEECDEELAAPSAQFQRQQFGGAGASHCSEFSRLLLDMNPGEMHEFLLAVSSYFLSKFLAII
jgi:hypothetical protein